MAALEALLEAHSRSSADMQNPFMKVLFYHLVAEYQ